MINRKEYSDLPAEQKLVYIKRTIIVACVSIIPIIIVLVVGFSMMFSLAEMINEINMNSTNSTIIDDEIKDEEYESEMSLLAVGFLVAFLIIIFALIEFGSSYGNEVADRLKLYTDLDVERLERKIAKVKEVLK